MTPTSGIRAVAAAIVLIAATAAPVSAQVPTETPRSAPVPAGPFRLYPLFTLQTEHDDNVFSDESEEIDAASVSIAPGVLAELPRRRGELRLGYVGRLRTYDGVSIPEEFSHFFRATGRFPFGTGWFVEVDDDFQRGVIEARRFDPGGEITFRGDRFEANTLRVDLGREVTDRSTFLVSVQSDVIDFRRVDDRSPFFDTDGIRVSVIGRHRRGPRTTILWRATAADATLEREIFGVFDARDREDREAAAGVQLRFSPGSQLEATVGWLDNSFRSGDRTTFGGPVWNVEFRRAVPARARVTARLSRLLFPSIFANNDYYITDRVTVNLENAREASLRLRLQTSFSENDYPEPDPDRRDHTTRVEASVGHVFRNAIELRLYGAWSRRTSTVAESEFDGFRFGTVLTLGG